MGELEALSGKKRAARLDAIREACQNYINGPLLEQLSGLLRGLLETAKQVVTFRDDLGYLIWRLVCWNHWKIPSAQKCYLCSRYILLPMSPGWTKKDWSGREDLNLRAPGPEL